jgi:hypothetical protein
VVCRPSFPSAELPEAQRSPFPELSFFQIHSLVMLQRLALANSYGWQRFLNSVNQVLPKRGAKI